ncbi:MAG: YbaN family protein [Candidatus Altiarchaeota archaeon]
MKEIQNPVLRGLLIFVGVVSVGLGFLGMFLPILPTTPFLLLAAACFIRSSKKMHNWLMTNRIFGNYIKSYLEGKGIPLRVKILTITLLWITIPYSVIFIIDVFLVRFVLLIIAITVTVHVVLIKTFR